MYWLCSLLVSVGFHLSIGDGIRFRVFDATKLRYEVHRYLVKLEIDRDIYTGVCTGSIISPRRIVTSAHCVTALDLISVIVYHQKRYGLEKIAVADLKKTSLHPDYVRNNITIQNRLVDIALVKTKAPMIYDEFVQPIELSEMVPKVSYMAIVAGYGEHELLGRGPREGAVFLADCPFAVDNLICVEDTVRAGDGDSGGALVYKTRLVGLISGSCKEVHVSKPCITVFSNVPNSLEWIRSVLANDDYLESVIHA